MVPLGLWHETASVNNITAIKNRVSHILQLFVQMKNTSIILKSKCQGDLMDIRSLISGLHVVSRFTLIDGGKYENYINKDVLQLAK